MYTKNDNIIIEEIKSYSPGYTQTTFRDVSGACITINNKDVIRIYECLKMQCEKSDTDFKEYCDNLFKGEA
jgi:hypothetical protein